MKRFKVDTFADFAVYALMAITISSLVAAESEFIYSQHHRKWFENDEFKTFQVVSTTFTGSDQSFNRHRRGGRFEIIHYQK